MMSGRSSLALMALAALIGVSEAIARGADSQPAAALGDSGPTGQFDLANLKLAVEIDRQSIGIADQLRMVLSAEVPDGTSVAFPHIAKTLGQFAVQSQISIGPLRAGDHRQLWQREVLLQPDAVGELAIPRMTIEFRNPTDPGSVPQWLSINEQIVTVTTVLADDADTSKPKDIAPPVPLDPPESSAWWMPLAAIPLLLFVLGTWWWRRRRRPGVAGPVLSPAHLLALEALRILQARPVLGEQQIDRFYMRLSDILRRYIAGRFGLSAPARTTEEVLAAAQSSGGPIAARENLLRGFLRHCDLVKFARHRPTEIDMRQALEARHT